MPAGGPHVITTTVAPGRATRRASASAPTGSAAYWNALKPVLRYVGERNSGFDSAQSSQPNFRMPAYTLTDLQGGVTLGPVDIGLYVRNLFDKRAILGADSGLVAFGSPLHATVAQPRTIGASLSTSF